MRKSVAIPSLNYREHRRHGVIERASDVTFDSPNVLIRVTVPRPLTRGVAEILRTLWTGNYKAKGASDADAKNTIDGIYKAAVDAIAK